jgi:hypothetical protein
VVPVGAVVCPAVVAPRWAFASAVATAASETMMMVVMASGLRDLVAGIDHVVGRDAPPRQLRHPPWTDDA